MNLELKQLKKSQNILNSRKKRKKTMPGKAVRKENTMNLNNKGGLGMIDMTILLMQ